MATVTFVPRAILTGGLALMAAVCLPGQTTASLSTAASLPTASSNGVHRTPAQVPPVLIPQFFAMGDRLTKPGNERLTMAGTLKDSSGTSPVHVVIELGQKLNITWQDQSGRKIVFNGTTKSVSGPVTGSGDLLQSFVDDLAETLLLAGRTTAPRFLGLKFTNPAGGFCDYYDVATFGQTSKATTPTVKRYCFDSKTSLLDNVRYQNSAAQDVVTQFKSWQSISNQLVPGVVARSTGGSQDFEFQAQTAAVTASVADSTFQP